MDDQHGELVAAGRHRQQLKETNPIHISVVNKSTLVTGSDARTMTKAVSKQLRYHVAPAWGKQWITVDYLIDESRAAPGSTVIGLFDDSDQAGALGWHTETQGGVTFGRVFARPVLSNGGDVLHKPLSVASVLSHECCEAFVDPTCALWADDGHGKLYALEVGDPVESDSYAIDSVTVSNFVAPSFFDAQAASGKHDYLGNVTQPFTMTKGGYMVVMEGGAEKQVFGEEFPEWRKETKASPLARTARRMHAA